MRTRSRGYTLIEILISMSLFLVLGASLVALLSRAMDFLSAGTGGTEVQDKARDFLRPFVRDVQNVVVERKLEGGTPVVRFLSDRIPFDSDGDGHVDYLAQRLVFVRSTNKESYDPTSRELALGGMEEVVWIAVPTASVERAEREAAAAAAGAEAPPESEEEVRADMGLLTLFRGVRSPVGGAGSLFGDSSVRDINRIRKVASPLLSRVLHFGVEFLGARGEWTSCWDSTRSREPNEEREFDFPWYVGADSENDASDDISPRAIRVTFAYERTSAGAPVGRLRNTVDPTGTKVEVDLMDFLVGANAPYIKVDAEWMQYAGDPSSDGVFSISKRGVRSTKKETHRPRQRGRRTRVRAGHTTVRTILVPSYREDWNSQ